MRRSSVPVSAVCAMLLSALALTARAQEGQPPTSPSEAAATAGVGAAPASEPHASSLGVVDFEGVMARSAAFREFQARFEARRRQAQRGFAALEADLRDAEAQLAQDRPQLEPDLYLQRRRAFEQQVGQAQATAQQLRAGLDEARQRAEAAIRNRLFEVISEVAADRRLRMVLDRNDVLIFDPALDLGEAAVRLLDERLQTVDVSVPDLPSALAAAMADLEDQPVPPSAAEGGTLGGASNGTRQTPGLE